MEKKRTYKANHPTFEESQYIIKRCETLDDYFADFIHGAGSESEAIRRIREYVLCSYDAQRKCKKL